ncbi:hypothetical protein CAOG_05155 [Capsaspora owczarzaki ATCC 30864]|uniref:Transmembrane protein n=1 Tax=Capsaspora owczarzaki (strain ATCC 30864) TaxID=595528 RepID=A0A0D2UHD6_CAPO3|nr:hypothetical protein CAOG_05155 [Capsaspora owczarzaki ATCC 30864]KJE94521.1 hypothetical protein CAOG_005155 [Capsaspora owczarzaki ATCC 30864]|eukprot:XP_004346840.2 hypothetical protein CAOG_05155 [Capsaspora owczarzaki ATCC 30864]
MAGVPTSPPASTAAPVPVPVPVPPHPGSSLVYHVYYGGGAPGTPAQIVVQHHHPMPSAFSAASSPAVLHHQHHHQQQPPPLAQPVQQQQHPPPPLIPSGVFVSSPAGPQFLHNAAQAVSSPGWYSFAPPSQHSAWASPSAASTSTAGAAAGAAGAAGMHPREQAFYVHSQTLLGDLASRLGGHAASFASNMASHPAAQTDPSQSGADAANSAPLSLGLNPEQSRMLTSALLSLTVNILGGLFVLLMYFNFILLRPYLAPMFWAVLCSLPLRSTRVWLGQEIRRALDTTAQLFQIVTGSGASPVADDTPLIMSYSFTRSLLRMFTVFRSAVRVFHMMLVRLYCDMREYAEAFKVKFLAAWKRTMRRQPPRIPPPPPHPPWSQAYQSDVNNESLGTASKRNSLVLNDGAGPLGSPTRSRGSSFTTTANDFGDTSFQDDLQAPPSPDPQHRSTLFSAHAHSSSLFNAVDRGSASSIPAPQPNHEAEGLEDEEDVVVDDEDGGGGDENDAEQPIPQPPASPPMYMPSSPLRNEFSQEPQASISAKYFRTLFLCCLLYISWELVFEVIGVGTLFLFVALCGMAFICALAIISILLFVYGNSPFHIYEHLVDVDQHFNGWPSRALGKIRDFIIFPYRLVGGSIYHMLRSNAEVIATVLVILALLFGLTVGSLALSYKCFSETRDLADTTYHFLDEKVVHNTKVVALLDDPRLRSAVQTVVNASTTYVESRWTEVFGPDISFQQIASLISETFHKSVNPGPPVNCVSPALTYTIKLRDSFRCRAWEEDECDEYVPRMRRRGRLNHQQATVDDAAAGQDGPPITEPGGSSTSSFSSSGGGGGGGGSASAGTTGCGDHSRDGFVDEGRRPAARMQSSARSRWRGNRGAAAPKPSRVSKFVREHLQGAPTISTLILAVAEGNFASLADKQLYASAWSELSLGFQRFLGNDVDPTTVLQGVSTSASALGSGFARSVLLTLTSSYNIALSVVSFMVNFGVSFVIFLSSLYYLLIAEHDVISALFNKLVMLDQHWKTNVSTRLSTSVTQVFSASLKTAAFHAIFTWLSFSVLGLDLVYISSLLAAFFALVPFVPSYLVSLIGFVQLLFDDYFWTGVFLVGAHLIVSWVVDPEILTEIKHAHPYITGLSILLGLYAFDLPGVVIGPLLVCVVQLIARLIQEQQPRASASATTAPPPSLLSAQSSFGTPRLIHTQPSSPAAAVAAGELFPPELPTATSAQTPH